VHDGEAVPGALSLHLGQPSDVVPPALEPALCEMRPGERARFTLSGDKGFGAPGFASLAREADVPPGANMVCEVELRAVNWRFVAPDGSVQAYWSRAAAREIDRMQRAGEWRALCRRPGPGAQVLLQAHPLAAQAGGAGAAAEGWSGSGEARWVTLGAKEAGLPEGVELAAREVAVRGVPVVVWLEEPGGGEALWGLVVEDWTETRDLAGDGGVVLTQERVGSLNALTRPAADADTVRLRLSATATRVDGADAEEWLPEHAATVTVRAAPRPRAPAAGR
jgi:hypothetical protein